MSPFELVRQYQKDRTWSEETLVMLLAEFIATQLPTSGPDPYHTLQSYLDHIVAEEEAYK